MKGDDAMGCWSRSTCSCWDLGGFFFFFLADLGPLCPPNRDRLYVEGECSMKKFQTKDGAPASALSIVQSEYRPSHRFFPDNKGWTSTC